MLPLIVQYPSAARVRIYKFVSPGSVLTDYPSHGSISVGILDLRTASPALPAAKLVHSEYHSLSIKIINSLLLKLRLI